MKNIIDIVKRLWFVLFMALAALLIVLMMKLS